MKKVNLHKGILRGSFLLILSFTSCTSILKSMLRNPSRSAKVFEDENIRKNFNSIEEEKISEKWPEASNDVLLEGSLHAELQNIFLTSLAIDVNV